MPKSPPSQQPSAFTILSRSTSEKPAHTVLEVIDLTGDDAEEDATMRSAPRSPKHIHPDADTTRPQPDADPTPFQPRADTAPTASARQQEENDGLPYDACFGLVSA